jgi:hypothetical protein
MNNHSDATHTDGTKPLQQLINLWDGILRLHHKELFKKEHASVDEFLKADVLNAKARVVLLALMDYQNELER